jgi:hypothetical protein
LAGYKSHHLLDHVYKDPVNRYYKSACTTQIRQWMISQWTIEWSEVMWVNVDLVKLNWWKATEAQTNKDERRNELITNGESQFKAEVNFKKLLQEDEPEHEGTNSINWTLRTDIYLRLIVNDSLPRVENGIKSYIPNTCNVSINLLFCFRSLLEWKISIVL